MEIQAFIKWCDAFLCWILAVLNEWVTLATGGVITAAIMVWIYHEGKSMTWQQFGWIAFVFVFLACFKAWKRERDKNDELGNRKLIDDELGRLHGLLVERIYTIRATPPLFYYEKYPQCLYPTKHDPDTSVILTSINQFLRDKISKSAAEIFDSQKGIKRAPVPAIDDPKWASHRDVLDILYQHESQLDEIMRSRLKT